MVRDTPLLKLRPDSLTRPLRLDLAKVEAIMMWPDDDDRQRAWWTAAMLEDGRHWVESMPIEVLQPYTRAALDAPRLPKLHEGADRRFYHGILAGQVVLSTLIYAQVAPEKAVLRSVIASLCQGMKGTYQVEPQTLNNSILPRYRPVVHLWAAFIFASEGRERPFPCGVASLPIFLATAEAIRRRAEQWRAKKSPTPLMRPGEAMRLPPDVAERLPNVDLRFTGSLTDGDA